MSLKIRIAAALEYRRSIAAPGEQVSQATLAVACGVKDPSVSAWFGGGTQSMRGSVLVKAASYLRVNPAYLAGNSPVMVPQGAAGSAAVVDVQELPRWPFAHELYLRFQRLDDDGKREVESDIRHRIDRIEEARRSPRKSTAQACGGG